MSNQDKIEERMGEAETESTEGVRCDPPNSSAEQTLHAEDWEERLRRFMGLFTVVSASIMGAAFFATIAWGAFSGMWDEIVTKHFPAVVGLPSSAVAALFVVLVLRTIAGSIEFKVAGFEFKGASGPIVMWILCFMAMTTSIWLLWDSQFAQ